TSVFVAPLRQVPRRAPIQRINGIPVTRLPNLRGTLSYLVPSLRVQVTAVGPEARQVIGTLTRSPRAVALAPGRAFAVPSGWRWHHFGGINFAAPGAWRGPRARALGNWLRRPGRAGGVPRPTATQIGCPSGRAPLP